MKQQNYKNIKYIFLVAIILLIGSIFFFQNDKTYLQKKTIKLLNLASSPSVSLSETAIFRRIHEIAKHIHFSVQYDMDFDSHLYQDRSLAELRSLMFVYFKKSNNWKIDIPSKEDLTVTMSVSEGKKNAEVAFPIKATQKNKNLSCSAVLHWIKEKKWLIHKMKVFSCSSANN